MRRRQGSVYKLLGLVLCVIVCVELVMTLRTSSWLGSSEKSPSARLGSQRANAVNTWSNIDYFFLGATRLWNMDADHDDDASMVAPRYDLLQNPKDALSSTAPPQFVVQFHIKDKGKFRAKCIRNWAPNGADRFYNLVRIGFYDGSYIFRVIDGFVMQFGISSDPRVSAIWSGWNILDDSHQMRSSNKRGYISFAHAGVNTRSTQVFINFKDNSFLDSQHFEPICLVDDMTVPDTVRATPEVNQAELNRKGEDYIKMRFPNQIDQIIRATLLI